MDADTEPPPKRKQPPNNFPQRPLKQQKPVTDADSTSNAVSMRTNGHDASEEEIVTVVPAAAGDSAEWQATIEKVISKVVSIHFCQTAYFDTDGAYTSEATGFVVDAEKGYIMTNRHVVGPGPFWGYCIFDNHEECDVHAVYRDPVHDFGFLRFDPKAIKYMPVTALQLRPDLAKVGAEIRVVGNDAGEKLSILSGVISRLDRNAPEYGEGYSDFNTNYIQAAAAASGGSSGSPVVNVDGHVVALQAGGRTDGAATDYFLPLDRPLRALECIRKLEPITRGTVQTQWLIKPFDECRRLGLSADRESEVRKKFPKETGMLVAEVVLPKGPADKHVEEGDVLIKVNDELLTQFVLLDDILDRSVGGQVKLSVQRGGEEIEVSLAVGDLHDITPDRYISVCGGSFHNLSYQNARNFSVPLTGSGVYCCHASGSFKIDVPYGGPLLQTVDNKPTPDMASFIEVMKGIPDRTRVPVTFKHLRDMHTLNNITLFVDRHWHQKMSLMVRNDETGLWDSKAIAKPLPQKTPKSARANYIEMRYPRNPAAAELIRSWVQVSSNIVLGIDGFSAAKESGFGLVVDAEQGLVVVPRSIVPYSLCDIQVTFAESIVIEAKVVFLHPLQNYAIIKYDPSLVQAPIRTAKLTKTPVRQGDKTTFFGFNYHGNPVIVDSVVSDRSPFRIPTCTSMPRYRAVGVDGIAIESSIPENCTSGALVDQDGTVQALWMGYLGDRSSSGRDHLILIGMGVEGLHPVLEEIRNGRTPKLRILDFESIVVRMSGARVHGVPEEWIERIEKTDTERHDIFMVRKLDAGHSGPLMESDIILTLNGKLITRITDFDVMYDKEYLDAVIVRKTKVMEVRVPTVPTESLETKRAVIFCGALLHAPHHAVRQQISKLHSQIYVTGRLAGSPAFMYGLAPTNFITHVNGVPTQDLDAFVRETNQIPDNTYFRLKLMTFDNQPWVVTMKKNDHYFPMQEFIKDDSRREGWKRLVYEDGKVKDEEADVPEGAEAAATEANEPVQE